MKQLGIKLLLLTLIVASICMAVDQYYRRLYDLSYPIPKNFFPKPEIADKYQIVKVGNSHASDGITFEAYKLRGLDLARIAQRFSYDLALLKHHAKQIEPNALIIIDASHLSFSHRIADRKDDVQNLYFGQISPWLIPDLKAGDYIQSELLPFLRSGYSLRERHAKAVEKKLENDRENKKVEEPTRVQTEQVAQPTIPPQPSNAQKLAKIYNDTDFNVEAIEQELASPSALPEKFFEADANFIYNKWYHTDEFNTKYFEMNRRDLEKIIEYVLQQGWRPVLITTPVVWDLEDALLDDYKQVYLYDNIEKTNLQGTEYLDFSTPEGLTKNRSLFKNADHLSRKGQIIFSYVLMNELIKRGYLPAEVDGYDYTPIKEYQKN